jgi:parvulin-like peptidyl-prolyl isomerase
MSDWTQIRLRIKPGSVFLWMMAVCLAASGAASGLTQSPAQPSQAVVLDRVVAVVNNRAILDSDVDEEMRLAALSPGSAVLTPKLALEQLISRSLIQQQIRQEDAQAASPSEAEVNARVAEIRKELPACLRLNCTSEE